MPPALHHPWLVARTRPVVVLDVGGADVNGGYRELFADPRYRYLTVDVAAEAGVDIVVSGQMLEHCEYLALSRNGWQ